MMATGATGDNAGPITAGRGLAMAKPTAIQKDSILTPRIADLLSKVGTAAVTSQLRAHGLRRIYMQGVQAMNPGANRFLGPAYTVRFIPMREDITTAERAGSPQSPQRRAIEEAPPGSIVCLDCRGDVSAGMAGDILVARLMVRKVGGLVMDGGMRDIREVTKLGFPVFCRAPSAPASFVAHHATDLQVPISCGGVAVLPGDFLMGDEDGVVVIPAALLEKVAEGAYAQEMLEQWTQRKVLEGRSIFGLYPPNEDAMKEFERETSKKKSAKKPKKKNKA
jgi:regulator of RNase E activity RraA